MSPIISKFASAGSLSNGFGGLVAYKKYRASGSTDTWLLLSSGYYNSGAYFRTNGNIVASQSNIIFQIDKDGNYLANTALSAPVSGSTYNSFTFNKTADVGAICAWDYSSSGQEQPVVYIPLSSSNGSSVNIIRGGSGYQATASIDNSGNLYRSYQAGQDGGPNDQRNGNFHKINSSAVTQWGKKVASVYPHNANSRSFGQIAVDSSGNVYAPTYVYNSDVSNGGALSKYNSSGTLQWRYYYGDTKTVPDSLYVDSSDNIYFLIGTGTYGTTPFWLVKINSSGTILFQQKYDLSGSAGPYNFSYGRVQYIDGSGNIYITIGWASSGNYGYSTLFKVNSSGSVLWANSFINGYGHGMSTFDIDPSFPEYYILSGAQGNPSVGGIRAYVFKGRTNGTIPGSGLYGNYTMSNNLLTVSTTSGTISATSRSITETTAETLTTSSSTMSSSSSPISSTNRL